MFCSVPVIAGLFESWCGLCLPVLLELPHGHPVRAGQWGLSGQNLGIPSGFRPVSQKSTKSKTVIGLERHLLGVHIIPHRASQRSVTLHLGGEVQSAWSWYTAVGGKASQLVLQETLHCLEYSCKIEVHMSHCVALNCRSDTSLVPCRDPAYP